MKRVTTATIQTDENRRAAETFIGKLDFGLGVPTAETVAELLHSFSLAQ